MEKYTSFDKKIWIYGAVYWLVLMVISSIMINPATSQPYMGQMLFHFILLIIGTGVFYYLFSKMKKEGVLNFKNISTIVLINVILDMVVLIGLIGVTFMEWIMLVFPAYIIGPAIAHKFLNK